MMNSNRKNANPSSDRGLGLGGGRGRNKGGAFGPGGFCVCAKCGEKVSHHQGVKCTTIKCPACGNTMVREELLNK
jgi:ribosomal protein S26